ncbi:MAG TPA: hypothetical protein VFT82_00380 [Candidatus Paceibacterota bacterium]|nr:hypothetical protein [Candidatus Paceibacterota bacterium]
MFVPLELKSNVRRSFQISIGLEEGYGSGIRHTKREVEHLIGEWIKSRMEKGEKSVAGAVVPGTMIYAWNSPLAGVLVNFEDLVFFVGDVSPLYCADYTDDEVKEVLRDLASFLGEALKQTRMYVAYRDEMAIYQDDKTLHPTGRSV